MKETYYDKLYYIFLKLNSFKNDYIFFEQIFKVFQLCFHKSYSKFHSQIISHFSLNQKKSNNSFTSFFNVDEPATSLYEFYDSMKRYFFKIVKELFFDTYL